MSNAATLSDSACFMILVVSVLIDMCRLFPAWLGDRLAFIGYLASIAIGFKNSGLFETIRGFIDGVAAAPQGLWDIPITRGCAQTGPQLVALIVMLITFGAMVPVRWSKWFGTFAQIQFADFRGLIGKGNSPNAIMKVTGPPGKVTGPPGTAPHPGARTWFRSLFPGTVNLGMVAVAVLFIVSASLAGSGVAGLMNRAIEIDVNTAAHLITPLLSKVAPGVAA